MQLAIPVDDMDREQLETRAICIILHRAGRSDLKAVSESFSKIANVREIILH